MIVRHNSLAILLPYGFTPIVQTITYINYVPPFFS